MKRKTKRKPAPRKTRDDCSTFDGDTAACQIVQLSDEIETLQNDVGDVLARLDRLTDAVDQQTRAIKNLRPNQKAKQLP